MNQKPTAGAGEDEPKPFEDIIAAHAFESLAMIFVMALRATAVPKDPSMRLLKLLIVNRQLRRMK